MRAVGNRPLALHAQIHIRQGWGPRRAAAATAGSLNALQTSWHILSGWCRNGEASHWPGPAVLHNLSCVHGCKGQAAACLAHSMVPAALAHDPQNLGPGWLRDTIPQAGHREGQATTPKHSSSN